MKKNPIFRALNLLVKMKGNNLEEVGCSTGYLHRFFSGQA